MEYVVETFKQGSKYEGHKLNDMRHGQGKFYYQDGGLYSGNWHCNKMDGRGSLYYQSGKLAYEGDWKDDQFQGHGKLYNESPLPLPGQFDYRNFDDIDDYWQHYEGTSISMQASSCRTSKRGEGGCNWPTASASTACSTTTWWRVPGCSPSRMGAKCGGSGRPTTWFPYPTDSILSYFPHSSTSMAWLISTYSNTPNII